VFTRFFGEGDLGPPVATSIGYLQLQADRRQAWKIGVLLARELVETSDVPGTRSRHAPCSVTISTSQ